MIYPLKDITLLVNIKGLSRSVFGLKIHSDRHIKKLAKYLGIAKTKSYKIPHLRALSYARPESRKVRFTIRYENAEAHMVGVVRLKHVLDKFYVFGSRLKDIINNKNAKLLLVQNYKYIRKIVGLPCHGQRSKTNAQTTKKKCRALLKKYPNRNRLYIKILKMISVHQSKDVVKYAQKLKNEREEMTKLRIIRELQGMRRYRHKSSENPDVHYENIYTQLKNKKRI